MLSLIIKKLLVKKMSKKLPSNCPQSIELLKDFGREDIFLS